MAKQNKKEVNPNVLVKQALECSSRALLTVCEELESLRERLKIAELEIVNLSARADNADLRAGVTATQKIANKTFEPLEVTA